MLSISNLLCNRSAGNESLRYGHVPANATSAGPSEGAPRPVVVWALTRACNLRCVHCYASANPHADADELTHDQGKRLLDDLHAFAVPAVLFSGGEPLVRPDALDLLRYACSLGLSVTLSTNGTLIDRPMAHRLADLGLRYVGISLDGLAKTHDKLRGQSGTFAQSLAAIDHCRAVGLKVGVRFTVHAFNQDQLEDIFQLCLKHDVNRLCIYHLAYAGRGGNMQKVDLSAEQTRDVVDRIFHQTRRLHEQQHELEVLTVGNHADAAYMLLQLEQEDSHAARSARARLERTGGNRSGINIASIDPRGDVHYDQFSWHYSCGNVCHAPFSEIWSHATDPRLSTLRNRQPHLPERCGGCRFLDICNGNLRTRAEAATGDWLGMDPSCYLNVEEISQPCDVHGVGR